jgi:hypothetical protein
MGQDVGILGQVSPTLDTDTDLYTAPAGRFAEVKVLVAERGGAAATFRVWVAPAGASTSNEQYIAYDEALAANEALTSVTFRVRETDVVRVRASTSNVSFTCTGVR